MGVYIKGVTKSQLMKVIINSTEFMPDDFEVIEVNSSEKPNNCETCIWSVCNYNKVPWGKEEELKTEPQTDCAWGKGEEK